jgi:hypothetical protein
MQAAAASAIRPLQQADQGTAEASSSEGPSGTRSVEEAGGAIATAQPRWDCNDGDTWHKRQQVSLRTNTAPLHYIPRRSSAKGLHVASVCTLCMHRCMLCSKDFLTSMLSQLEQQQHHLPYFAAAK